MFNWFIVVDDILIYLKSYPEHVYHVQKSLSVLCLHTGYKEMSRKQRNVCYIRRSSHFLAIVSSWPPIHFIVVEGLLSEGGGHSHPDLGLSPRV